MLHALGNISLYKNFSFSDLTENKIIWKNIPLPCDSLTLLTFCEIKQIGMYDLISKSN